MPSITTSQVRLFSATQTGTKVHDLKMSLHGDCHTSCPMLKNTFMQPTAVLRSVIQLSSDSRVAFLAGLALRARVQTNPLS